MAKQQKLLSPTGPLSLDQTANVGQGMVKQQSLFSSAYSLCLKRIANVAQEMAKQQIIVFTMPPVHPTRVFLAERMLTPRTSN